jgi:hypothetical protein
LVGLEVGGTTATTAAAAAASSEGAPSVTLAPRHYTLSPATGRDQEGSSVDQQKRIAEARDQETLYSECSILKQSVQFARQTQNFIQANAILIRAIREA